MTDFSTIAEGCSNIIRRIEDCAVSTSACETIGDLENFHDRLASEVINLAGTLRSAVEALAKKEAA